MLQLVLKCRMLKNIGTNLFCFLLSLGTYWPRWTPWIPWWPWS